MYFTNDIELPVPTFVSDAKRVDGISFVFISNYVDPCLYVKMVAQRNRYPAILKSYNV